MALDPSDAVDLVGDIPADAVPLIRLVKEDHGQPPVEILLPQLTPKAVATLFQVSSKRTLNQ